MRQIDDARTRAAFAGVVAAHRQAEDFVRACGELLRVRRAERNLGLALWAALVLIRRCYDRK